MSYTGLDDILSGSLCVVDADILLYAEQGLSQQARRLLRRFSTGDLIGIIPDVVWQELIQKLMLAEAVMSGKISGPDLLKEFATGQDVIKELGLYREKIEALLELGLGYEPSKREDLLENAFKLQEKYGLLPKESVILAVAVRLDADVLVTADTSFRGVKEVELAFPSDLNV